MPTRHLASPRAGRATALAALLLSLGGCGAPREVGLIVLITVDTLRADHLGVYGGEFDLTPHLDALARESLLFESAYAPTSFTLPSVSGLLTGRHPETLGVVSNRSALPADVPTLASELRERGWRTRAVVSNFVLRANSGLDRGFEHYDDAMYETERARRWPERVAAGTTEAALRALDALLAPDETKGAPAFLWVHYQDPHGPYTPPEDLRERYLGVERAREGGRRRLPVGGGPDAGGIPNYQIVGDEREVAFYRAGYAGEVARVDAEIGRLLAALRERDLWDRAVVVFSADHGESLGESDYWFAHGARLSEALVRVPLLVRAPGIAPGIRADVASLLDVFPTLLRRVDPSAPAPGRDLLEEGAEEAASTPYLATLGGSTTPRFGLVSGDWKLVATARGGRFERRLSRRDRGDADLSASEPDRSRELLARLLEIRAGLERRPGEVRQRLGESDREALRALGYLDAPEGEAGLPRSEARD